MIQSSPNSQASPQTAALGPTSLKINYAADATNTGAAAVNNAIINNNNNNNSGEGSNE